MMGYNELIKARVKKHCAMYFSLAHTSRGEVRCYAALHSENKTDEKTFRRERSSNRSPFRQPGTTAPPGGAPPNAICPNPSL